MATPGRKHRSRKRPMRRPVKRSTRSVRRNTPETLDVVSLSMLWSELAKELASWCQIDATLDCKKLERRVREEGIGFLAITLPNFAKDFERSLDAGFVDATAFSGFHRRGGLPLFLEGFLAKIFDPSSGVMVQGPPDIDAIFAVRSLTRIYSKIELPVNKRRTALAMKGYLDCEQELAEKDHELTEAQHLAFRRVSSLLFDGVLHSMDRKVRTGDLRPRHGPGATADRLKGNRKFEQRQWTTRLEQAGLTFGEYCLPNWRYYYQLDHVQFLEPGLEQPVRVIPVPKTLKTPRIIAIEPTCMQYMQQALARPMVERLEPYESVGLPSSVWTKEGGLHSVQGFLGFRDQDPNRDLARRGSRDGTLATLDLSEASDRVLNSLVLDLAHGVPHFSEALQATRSLTADVPLGDGVQNVALVKYASMGSALCFPIEAMVFLTCVFLGIERSLKAPLSRRDVESYLGKVRVFGDDIICPLEHVSDVIASLESFGFKVNRDKSFWTGKFRESCGGEYYDGHDVKPVKLRRKFPNTHHDASEVISLVSARNKFYELGLWRTASWLDEKIEKILHGVYPIVPAGSPAVSRVSYLSSRTLFSTDGSVRMHATTHRPMVKAWVQSSRPPASWLDGEGALLKVLLAEERLEPLEAGHLERQGRPACVGIKKRGIPLHQYGVEAKDLIPGIW